MSLKEELIEIVRAEGYGFMTACETVTRAMTELKPCKNVLNIGKVTITIDKEEVSYDQIH